MLSVTLDSANNNLQNIVYHALDSSEEVSIASNRGAVVMIAQDDYNAMQETLRLLRDKKSLKALLDSHQQRDSGKPIKSYSVSEVFNDLQD
jgi:PHD/YefM family antitoxin component YafN of YafNO toxin-antitoxin module